ncbi:hypothetical protein J32TS2_06580 [Shouchella clausii]|nr:hypothetical protein J1TS1_11210 [Shouchella clausii]GIN15302.1 hypothetical protein J32TS2_06580 [Shouchella clausii]
MPIVTKMKSLGNREFVLTKKYVRKKGIPIKKAKKVFDILHRYVYLIKSALLCYFSRKRSQSKRLESTSIDKRWRSLLNKEFDF